MDRTGKLLIDADFDENLTLPTADGTVQTTGFDLGAIGDRDVRPDELEIWIRSPALNTTQLPDADTLTWSVESDDNSGFTSALIVADKVMVQTGAGGAGAAAKECRFKIPPGCERYVRIKAVAAGGTGDISGSSADVSLVF